MPDGLVKVSAVIPAAGTGSRMAARAGPLPKQFMKLRGRPLLDWTLEAVSLSTRVDEIVLVVGEAAADDLRVKYLNNPSFQKIKMVVAGGDRRADSVFNGIAVVSNDWVLLHDAVRPFVSARLIEITINAALKHGAAAAALPVSDTVKKKNGPFLGGTMDRDSILLVQTPQVFRKKILLSAFESMRGKDEDWTDETSLLMAAGMKVAWVTGERTNIKITNPDDLELANAIALNM
jgi:2-C-methyl-D-erythritol 4-phosphate cytidylyltransferase